MEALLVVTMVAASTLLQCEAVVLPDQNSPLCECVPYYDCSGAGVQDRNCTSFLDVCCQPNDIIESCTCVPYYECTNNNTPVGKCSKFLDVCCQPSDIKRESCTCVPYYECTTRGKESDNPDQCPGELDVCCIEGTEAPPTRQTPRPPTPPPIFLAEEECSTIGTREGICIPFSDCSDKLQEPVRLLTLEQFVHNYGCGVLRGIARVCCPLV